MEQSEVDRLREKLNDGWNRFPQFEQNSDNLNLKASVLLRSQGEAGPMVELLTSQNPIDPWTRLILAEMLLGVSDTGINLAIKRKRGRPSGPVTDDTLHIGEVAENRIANGEKAEEADRYVAKLFRVSEPTVKKGRQEWRKFLRHEAKMEAEEVYPPDG